MEGIHLLLVILGLLVLVLTAPLELKLCRTAGDHLDRNDFTSFLVRIVAAFAIIAVAGALISEGVYSIVLS